MDRNCFFFFLLFCSTRQLHQGIDGKYADVMSQQFTEVFGKLSRVRCEKLPSIWHIKLIKKKKIRTKLAALQLTCDLVNPFHESEEERKKETYKGIMKKRGGQMGMRKEEKSEPLPLG